MTDLPIRADLLIHGAALVATVDDDRRELAGGWVAITDGLISGVGGSTDPMPEAERIIDAGGWERVVERHRRPLMSILSRLALPHDALSVILSFWSPPGGH